MFKLISASTVVYANLLIPVSIDRNCLSRRLANLKVSMSFCYCNIVLAGTVGAGVHHYWYHCVSRFLDSILLGTLTILFFSHLYLGTSRHAVPLLPPS